MVIGTSEKAPAARQRWCAAACLLAGLAVGQPGRAERLVDNISGTAGAVQGTAGAGPQAAAAFELGQASRLAAVDWLGGYYAADIGPAAPVRFVFQLYRSEGYRPAAAPLLSLTLRADARPGDDSFSGGLCQADTCSRHAYRSPLPAIELAAGKYWLRLSEADERTIDQGDSRWLWARSDLPGEVATRNGDDGAWLAQSGGTLQFALEGTAGLATTADSPPSLLIEKTVDNATPAPSESVEFTLRVSNLGSETISDVRVQEHLPPELMIPEGTAPAAGQGVYDLASQQWLLGDLAPEASATLRLPAIVSDAATGGCISNRASLSQADSAPDLGEATAVLSAPGSERCVDVGVSFDRVTYDGQFCDLAGAVRVTIALRNSGPDTARDIAVNLVQQPAIAPNLRFVGCPGDSATQCRLAELASGETARLEAVSDSFVNQSVTRQTLTVSASSAGDDHAPGNDRASRELFVADVSCGCEGCAPDYYGDDWNTGTIGPGCFIATAAYGSWLDPHVAALRRFRDERLLPYAAGRAMVRFYYRHSPPIADYIAPRPWLRAATRLMLAPVVWAVQFPLLAALLLLAAGAGCARRMRGVRQRQR